MDRQFSTPIWLYSDHLLEYKSLVLSPSFRTSIWIENFPLIFCYNKHFCVGDEIGKSETIQYFICVTIIKTEGRKRVMGWLITIFHGQQCSSREVSRLTIGKRKITTEVPCGPFLWSFISTNFMSYFSTDFTLELHQILKYQVFSNYSRALNVVTQKLVLFLYAYENSFHSR